MKQIVLPWPPPQLMPNFKRRRHWSRYHKQIRAAEMLGFGLALQAAIKPVDGDTIPYRLALTPPMRGGPIPDEDNVIAACKHYLDGIARAMRVNDRAFRNAGITWHSKSGDGSVMIEVGDG